MVTYTYSKARQNLASLLDKAKKEGRVLLKRRDGSLFEIRAIKSNASPLDVGGIDINISAEEILAILRESREQATNKD